MAQAGDVGAPRDTWRLRMDRSALNVSTMTSIVSQSLHLANSTPALSRHELRESARNTGSWGKTKKAAGMLIADPSSQRCSRHTE